MAVRRAACRTGSTVLTSASSVGGASWATRLRRRASRTAMETATRKPMTYFSQPGVHVRDPAEQPVEQGRHPLEEGSQVAGGVEVLQPLRGVQVRQPAEVEAGQQAAEDRAEERADPEDREDGAADVDDHVAGGVQVRVRLAPRVHAALRGSRAGERRARSGGVRRPAPGSTSSALGDAAGPPPGDPRRVPGVRAEVDVPISSLAPSSTSVPSTSSRARFRFLPSGSTQVSTRRSVPRSRRVYAVGLVVMTAIIEHALH